MIRATHLNKQEFYLNSDLVLCIEETPDTLILMTSGERIMVQESAEELVERIVAFKRRVIDGQVALNILHHPAPERADGDGGEG